MKKWFRRFLSQHLDEMARQHNYRAQQAAYYFLITALLVWTVCESISVYIHHTKLNLIPCLLLVIASLIQTFTRLILTRRAVKDDEDSYITAPLIRIVLLTCIVIAVIVTVVMTWIIGGTRI